MPRRWERVFSIPGGHRFFQDAENSRIAIADDSGTTPEDTNDGILYLHRSGLILIPDDTIVRIPLLTPSNHLTSTLVNMRDARTIASEFKMMFDCRGY